MNIILKYIITGVIACCIIAVIALSISTWYYKKQVRILEVQVAGFEAQLDIQRKIAEKDKEVIENAKREIEKIRSVTDPSAIADILNQLHTSNHPSGNHPATGKTDTPHRAVPPKR